jgi:Nuclease-related domain
LIVLVPMCIVAFPSLWLSRLKTRGKRSPLTRELLRSPGESLRQKLDEINVDIDACLFMSVFVPLSIYAIFLTQLHFAIVHNPALVAALYGFFVLFCEGYVILKLTKAFIRRNQLRLGLDAEAAIGQELNQLMLDGYRVYHDFQADKFNIDHIVIGQNGVFAVETKGKAKPKSTDDKKNWSVIYDGQALQFPNWTERDYLPQARRQAEWLAKWLSSAVGEAVTVRPALAITGWNTELRKPCDVIIFSGKNPPFSKIKIDTPLTAGMIQRITHQLEQKCRDVEPQAYKKSE